MLHFLWFTLALFCSAAFAAETPWVNQPHTRVQLISDHDSVEAGKPFVLGLHFHLDPQWHIYWKNPGDSGLPTMVEWLVGKNASVGALQFPAPERIYLPPIVSYGHDGEVLLLAEATSQTNFSAVAKVTWLVCKLECIPGEAELRLNLPLEKKARLAKSAAFALSKAKQALPVGPKKFSWREKNDFWVLSLPGWPDKVVPYFYSEAVGLVESGLEQVWKDGELWVPKSKISATVRPALWQGVVAGEGVPAWQLELDPQLMASQEASTLWLMLFYAFLGGILLNLMPCVFPVLALKGFGLLRHAKESKHTRLTHALFYFLGVLASFWVLALIVILFRSTGSELGWGFQLQSPGFVAGLGLLLFAFGLNLLGYFELSGRFTGYGQNWVDAGGNIGTFASGVLTVLVATPCTAPFMAAALGAALLQPGWGSVAIFTALGIGLALPYVGLCVFPGWFKLLPKPGAWMKVLKEFFAFPLFATSLWLLWIYLELTSPFAVLYIGAAILSGLFLLWVLKNKLGKLALLLGLVCLGGSFWLVTKAPHGSSKSLANQWQEFSPALLQKHLVNKKAVFVDFTAAWCLTCQANKHLVFSDAHVMEELKKREVELLLADWTSYDPVITQALRGYGRAGVPLYVYYPKGELKPRILPQVLTPQSFLKAIE